MGYLCTLDFPVPRLRMKRCISSRHRRQAKAHCDVTPTEGWLLCNMIHLAVVGCYKVQQTTLRFRELRLHHR